MTIRILIILSIIGVLAGIFSVYYYQQRSTVHSTQNASTISNPYHDAIYASCIVDNAHPNIIIYPEISGRVKSIAVEPGDTIKINNTILVIDDSIQQELVNQDLQLIQRENASVVTAEQQLQKLEASSVKNQNTIEQAIISVTNARQRLAIANSQYYSDKALLNKAVVKAPQDGIIIKIVPSVGDYVSVQPNPHTHEKEPIVYMSLESPFMRVRCFIDEILVPQLPSQNKLEATMFVKGSNYEGLPLDFVRIEPNIIPNTDLITERIERSHIRVLPIIFRFQKPSNLNIYPGQSVDVYIKKNPS